MYKGGVSIIIPTFNNGPEIERAVKSIINQQQPENIEYNLQIIIVNDGSAAEFTNGLQQLATNYRAIELLQLEKQMGPAAARNFGIKQAKGDIIGFLDADDEWPEDKLMQLLPFFEDDVAEVAGGKIQYVIDEGQASPILRYEDTNHRLTHVHLGSLLVRKTIFDRGFYFNESLKFSEDLDWWLRLRENNIHIVITEFTTLLYHVHGNNMSVNKSLKELQLLKVLHASLQRRNYGNQTKQIPQVADFRVLRNEPLISIIVPLYNGKAFIEKTIQGVLAQTYTNWELCIIDDGSSDGGAEWIEKHYPVAKITRQKNAGVAAARNKGIKVSSGELIAFLDQDDEWLQDKLTTQWNILRSDPYCAFVTCNQRLVCYDNVDFPVYFDEKLKEEHRSFIPSALLIRRHALLSIGGFKADLTVSSDMDLIRRLRNAGFKEDNADVLLLLKWLHGTNASFNKKLLRNEILNLLHKQMNGR